MSKEGLGMGGHQSGKYESEDWITPQHILTALGPFDLDPCASINQPWPCATISYTKNLDGLLQPWHGFVWLNPPYGLQAAKWLKRLAIHHNGIALIFARTETKMFHAHVWNAADTLLFLKGRLYFHYPNGTRAAANAGAPSVLVGYGPEARRRLQTCGLSGALITDFQVF